MSSAMSLVNVIVLIVVVPVVAVYMLLDWDHMIAVLMAVAAPRTDHPRSCQRD